MLVTLFRGDAVDEARRPDCWLVLLSAAPKIFRFRGLPCRKTFFPKSRAKSAFN